MTKKEADYFKLSYLAVKIFSLLLILFILVLVNYFAAKLYWGSFILAGIILYFLFNRFGKKIFAAKYGWSVSQVGFSPARIISGVVLLLTLGLIYFQLLT